MFANFCQRVSRTSIKIYKFSLCFSCFVLASKVMIYMNKTLPVHLMRTWEGSVLGTLHIWAGYPRSWYTRVDAQEKRASITASLDRALRINLALLLLTQTNMLTLWSIIKALFRAKWEWSLEKEKDSLNRTIDRADSGFARPKAIIQMISWWIAASKVMRIKVLKRSPKRAMKKIRHCY